MFKLFAHARELHDSQTTAVEHLILIPFVYGAINALVLLVVIGILRVRRASLGTQLLTAMGLLLVGGVVGYQLAPVVGAIMIALGIALALVSVLLSIISSVGDSQD